MSDPSDRAGMTQTLTLRTLVVSAVALLGCSKTERAADVGATEVGAAEKARGAAIVAELKRSLVGALQGALANGAPTAITACHEMAPAIAAALARDGVTVGRTTRKPRNPANAARGWQADALTEIERQRAAHTTNTAYARRLPDGRIGYAEPLIVQELCLTCHGANVAPEIKSVLAARYPDDTALGYAVGDLRGIAWVELPAR
jgi:Protein of unknown function (DUF3365)